ncbi:HAD family hydrolase [Nostocaceae cyanobacterium CENA369]|uniref:HAD family hydrolase n=1 Tax=Dendronalium phyllosphericum CENA369 TaxID=1725256 RepID=A0A8J7I8X6_9NOST|nr:HAD family hydrolase [Dendronalium phyllosphericum]MBH8574647.1 HAD family hydrolase [Dendronalium phyllosphericum CENA369]
MKLVIFDIDGTLTNTYKIDEDCFVNALKSELKISDINRNWAEYTHVTDSGITQQIFIEKLGRIPSNEEVARIKIRFVNLLQEACNHNQDLFSEISGSANLLANLCLTRDWCVAIATGGWRESAELKLQKANLKIESIPLASADDGISRTDIVNTAIVKAKNIYKIDNFKKIVFVGDGTWDVKVAYQLSIAMIGIGSGKVAQTLLNVGATKVIKDFTDLNYFIKILETATIPK